MVLLSKSAVDELAAYLANDSYNRGPGDLIFAASRGGRRYATLLGGNFRRACDKAGLVTEWSWHDLRHYFGSRLIFRGCDVKTVSELLGHSSPNMTCKVYVHLWPGQDDALRETWTKRSRTLLRSDGMRMGWRRTWERWLHSRMGSWTTPNPPCDQEPRA